MNRENRRKVKRGIVVSHKMDKSVVVSIEKTFQHPLYRKLVKQTTKVIAHDEDNSCRTGDEVTIAETRPLSKRKRWRVTEITSASGEERQVMNGVEGEGDL
jgi:small subunit ribosomal protein S17